MGTNLTRRAAFEHIDHFELVAGVCFANYRGRVAIV
jgi:hypothetical protein